MKETTMNFLKTTILTAMTTIAAAQTAQAISPGIAIGALATHQARISIMEEDLQGTLIRIAGASLIAGLATYGVIRLCEQMPKIGY